MLIQQTADTLRLEIAALNGAWFQQNLHQAVLQFMAHPVHQRQRKTLLRAIQKLRWDSQALRQLLEQELPRSVPVFVLHRQSRHPLHENVIEYWTAHLQRVGHAHTIHFSKYVPGEISFCVQISSGLTDHWREPGRNN